MRRIIGVLLLLLLLAPLSGCLRGLSPETSSPPEVIVDYDATTQQLKCWVKSPITDYRYDRLSITIENGTTTMTMDDNYTYCIDLAVPYRQCTINTTAQSKDYVYTFTAECRIRNHDPLQFEFTYRDKDDDKDRTEEIAFEDLPWKKILREQESRNRR